MCESGARKRFVGIARNLFQKSIALFTRIGMVGSSDHRL